MDELVDQEGVGMESESTELAARVRSTSWQLPLGEQTLGLTPPPISNTILERHSESTQQTSEVRLPTCLIVESQSYEETRMLRGQL